MSARNQIVYAVLAAIITVAILALAAVNYATSIAAAEHAKYAAFTSAYDWQYALALDGLRPIASRALLCSSVVAGALIVKAGVDTAIHRMRGV